ncbi:hypothetical protein F5Y11DRAFT_338003 [Daldinia sp. FL1419]|nr:hypothetical protein F5Y11DRAFT_338003 [Daldinia sp. FL1419]
MGRQLIDFEPYKDQITTWFNENLTTQQILSNFHREYRWKPAPRTLNRTLRKWGLRKQHHIRTNTLPEDLKDEILYLFFQFQSTDKRICEILKTKGYNLSPRQLQKIRFDLGLKRRTTTPEEKQLQINAIRAAIFEETKNSGRIGELGRRYLHDYIRDKNGNYFPRDTLYEIYKEFFPDAVHQRTWRKRRQKGEFIVYGPNQVWSIDGHDKLLPWGIHIYGAIDGYSRFLVWYQVSYAGSTAISTLKQYLRAVRKLGYTPRTCRADRGKELPLLSAAHWTLVRAFYENYDGSVVEFGDCFYYGRSMDNTRIEFWWGQLQRSCLNRWRSLFHRMEAERTWIFGDLACQIALLAVYVPIIENEIKIFVKLWNNHDVRTQRNRANALRGRPWDNFFTPNTDFVSQWGAPVDVAILAEIEAAMENDDIDRFLPDNTLQWCEEKLRDIGLDRTKEDNRQWPFVEAYNKLRTEIQAELENGNPAGLYLLTPSARGGLAGMEERLTKIRNFPSENQLNTAVREAYERRNGIEEEFNLSQAPENVETMEHEELLEHEEIHRNNMDLNDWRNARQESYDMGNDDEDNNDDDDENDTDNYIEGDDEL